MGEHINGCMHKYSRSHDNLPELSRQIRRTSLRMVHAAGVGHPGGDLSAADILTVLYFRILRLNPRDPLDPLRDRFIMSKGHCSGVFYAVLAKAGFFPEDELTAYMQPGARLNGHPPRGKVPGVEASTGPLGHGLPVAVGNALGAKADGADWRTFVLTGDGELQEGSNWEAAMAAAHYKLDNLTLIVDRNGLQLTDSTERTIALEPLADKWRAFGWSVHQLDGHDHAALEEALKGVPFVPGRPNCVIANTHKGQGVSFMIDNVKWHHRIPSDQELEGALVELEGDVS
jgi:transketolase